MTKREDKKLRRQEANAVRKSVTGVNAPASSKVVGSASLAPQPIDDIAFAWSARFIDEDHDGSWNWKLSPKETKELLRVLEELSNMSWREVKTLKTNSKSRTRALNHSQAVESICTEAQNRLESLHLDLDEVFRLRHGNLTRIWGYLQGPVFHLLWYDRHHAVCPSAS